jgi:hypothetical protein
MPTANYLKIPFQFNISYPYQFSKITFLNKTLLFSGM